ncbi:fibronectin type III domain-containing protein [Nocardioides sp. R1-1]|uniref:fibronectin type III domain-containing protein n=1 Tax=Nocardioides sp. R1-1 TaxID=3383502 RepID=UPI0038D24D2B
MTKAARLLAALLLVSGPLLVGAGPADAAGRPSAPRTVRAEAGNGAVTVSWRPPARRGGSAVQKYAIQQQGSSGAWTTVKTVGKRARSWQVGDLRNGVSYAFRVRARNKARWSKPGPVVTAVPRTVPGAPGAPEADLYASALGVYWRTPPANGAPIDRYRVEVSADGAVWTTVAEVPRPGTAAEPVMVTGLAPGSRYWLRVAAHNAAGYGGTAGTGPYTARRPPGPPTNVTALAGDATVALTWLASEVDEPGETASGHYRVEQSTDGGATWSLAAETDDTEVVLAGLANEVEHLFRVSARSTTVRIGYGAPSAPVATTPHGPDPVYTLSVDPPELQLAEEGPDGELVVSLGAAAEEDVVLAVTSSAPLSVGVPATVTVPAGQASVAVPLTALPDDDASDAVVTVTVTFGEQVVEAVVTVLDDDV